MLTTSSSQLQSPAAPAWNDNNNPYFRTSLRDILDASHKADEVEATAAYLVFTLKTCANTALLPSSLTSQLLAVHGNLCD